nr:helix-turn-helix transcriptional regulator [Desulfotruncus arcticus]
MRKKRFLRNLTAAQLGNLCGCTEQAIYAYESGVNPPHHSIMEKICLALKVPVGYFEDDYYNFILSDKYTSFIRQWRKKNTKRCDDVGKMLGVSIITYLDWEKGKRMSRDTFEKIRGKIGK